MSSPLLESFEAPVQQALKRGTRTLESVLRNARARDVGSLQATTNESTFLIAAARLAVESGFVGEDAAEKEFQEARLRGLARVVELRRLAEPCLDTRAVAELLGVSRETIRKKVDRKQLLALPKGSEDRVFPAFQFQGGAVVPGLEEVLGVLNTEPFVALSFLLGRNRFLGNKTAIAALKDGMVAEVMAEAGSFLEHGS